MDGLDEIARSVDVPEERSAPSTSVRKTAVPPARQLDDSLGPGRGLWPCFGLILAVRGEGDMVSRPAALARGGQPGGRSCGLVMRSGVIRYQRTLVGVALVSLALAGCGREKNPPPPPATSESPRGRPRPSASSGPLSEADAAALATMNDRLKDYVDLHRKLERTLPKLPEGSDADSRSTRTSALLEKLVREARAARSRATSSRRRRAPVIKRLLAAVFGGPDGKQLKESIMDENPVDRALGDGQRPLSRQRAGVHRPAPGAADAAEAERGHGVPLHRRLARSCWTRTRTSSRTSSTMRCPSSLDARSRCAGVTVVA